MRIVPGIWAGVVLVLLASNRSEAITIWGVTPSNILFKFDSASPQIIQTAVPLRIPASNSVLAMDFRPQDQRLYILTTEGDVYSVNTTAPNQANYWDFYGEHGRVRPLNGTSFGFDFDPVSGRARVTSDTDMNVSFGIDGTSIVQTPLTRPGRNPAIVGSAYSNNFPGATTTTLFNIDASGNSTGDDFLMSQPIQENGVQQTVGSLQELFQGDELGFDIAANNVGYIVGHHAPHSQLFSVNLTTGQASYLGDMGTGMVVRDIAVVVPEPSLGFGVFTTMLAILRRNVRQW